MKNYNTLKKTAFTLAETLITLGIIGIVAAITIPTLITNYQKKVIPTKLKRAISVMNQAYKSAYDDIGEATPSEVRNMGGVEYVKKYWAPYLKISNICDSYTTCGYKRSRPFKELDGSKYTQHTINNIDGNVVWFQTIDGYVYAVWYYEAFPGIIASFMYVDITGGGGPNVFGKDLFILSRVIDGDKGGFIAPYGYSITTESVNNGCVKGGNNSSNTCAEKIRRAGWQIDSSYPW